MASSDNLERLILSDIHSNSDTAGSKSARPALKILDLLPRSSLLNLRLVSKYLRIWVEKHQPPLLSSLEIPFPLPNDLPLNSLSTLTVLALYCQNLTVKVLPQPGNTTTSATALPSSLPSLAHLTIISPNPDDSTFQHLLTLRLALQTTTLPRLTNLTLSNLSIKGILALRTGPFTSFASNADTDFFRNITSLSLSVIPWWLPTDSSPGQNKPPPPLSHTSKNGFKILHSFLTQFSPLPLLYLSYTWLSLSLEEGPNPFLLDSWAASTSRKGWFSARGIRWRSVKAVRLRGVEITDSDVREMRDRIRGLKVLEVETAWGEEEVRGGLVAGDKVEWVVDVLATLDERDEGQVFGDEVQGGGLRAEEARDSSEKGRRGITNGRVESFQTDWSDGSIASLGLGV